MLHKRSIALLTIALMIAAGAWALAAKGTVDQSSTLSGQVVAQGLVTPGMPVREGAILVNVNTITGALPAARANADGVVKEVLVKPGDTIRTGDVVARIESVSN